MALGADARGVVRLVLGRTLGLVAAGLVLGAALSLGLARFVESLLFGLTPHDPATLAGAAAVLLAMGVAAAGLPALRATRIDPAQVLREG
jgi:ABC-type antimicrobial peptide transport system permease subunit